MEFAPETELDATRRELSELRREIGDLRARMGFPAAGSPEDIALQLAAIVESSDDAIFSLDLDGVIRSWNGGAERILGYKPHEMVGRRRGAEDLFANRGMLREALDCVRRGEVEKQETELRRNDGIPATVSLTASPV